MKKKKSKDKKEIFKPPIWLPVASTRGIFFGHFQFFFSLKRKNKKDAYEDIRGVYKAKLPG